MRQTCGQIVLTNGKKDNVPTVATGFFGRKRILKNLNRTFSQFQVNRSYCTLPSLDDPVRRQDTLPAESPANTRSVLVSQHSAVMVWPLCSQDTPTRSGRPRLSSCSSHTTTRPWLEQKHVKGGWQMNVSYVKMLHYTNLVATATKSSSWGQHATWVIDPS